MKKREKTSKMIFFVFTLFLLWSFLQILPPSMLSSNSVLDLSGQTLVIDNNHIIETMPFPTNIIYYIGDRLCHQQADRSFFLNGNQMPFCSRCTAIWIGFPIGLALLFFLTISLNERFLYLMLFSLVPMGVDGIGQLFGLWESTNIIRLITGLITGIVFGMTIGIIIDECKSLLKFNKIQDNS